MVDMPKMRKMAGRVLVIWLASWSFIVLQPCCESVASSLPHEHHAPPSAHSHQTNHHDTNAGIPAQTAMAVADIGHKHCDSDGDNAKWIADALPKESTIKYDQKQSTFIAGIDVRLASIAPGNILTIHHAAQPPPSRQPTYLVTQRFRI